MDGLTDFGFKSVLAPEFQDQKTDDINDSSD